MEVSVVKETYYLKNQERLKDYRRQKYQENKERYKEYSRNKYLKNKDFYLSKLKIT